MQSSIIFKHRYNTHCSRRILNGKRCKTEKGDCFICVESSDTPVSTVRSRIYWMDWKNSNTAAMTPRASPWWKTVLCASPKHADASAFSRRLWRRSTKAPPRSASATRVGRPTASPATPTPTRIKAAAGASAWCTTASSKTTCSSKPLYKRTASSSVRRPTPR